MLRNYEFLLAQYPAEIDGAEEYFKRALEANPNDPDILANYANFLAWKRGDLDGADIYYQRALEADPKPTPLFLGNYGTFLAWYRGDLDGAEEYFKRTLEIDPKRAGALNNYGQLLVGLARLSEGERLLLSAFQHYDLFLNDAYNRGVFFALARFADAGTYCGTLGTVFQVLYSKGFQAASVELCANARPSEKGTIARRV